MASVSARIIISIIFMLLLAGCEAARPIYPLPSKNHDKQHKKPLQTFRPYNLAHRGSNGEFPEETAAAYTKAIEEGADFIETDILATKDGVLICSHDPYLDVTTDIADHTEFADRKRTYELQGSNFTGYFVVDFTLDELKTLRVKQRYSFRDRNTTVKWADGKKFEDVFVRILKKYGYKGSYMSKEWLKQPVFIQSFAPSSLVYVSNLTELPKILLIDDTTVFTEDTNQSYWEITSDKYFDYIKDYVVGIGPWKDTVDPVSSDNHLETATDLVSRAHAHNLQVHPYTFRNENQFLHFDFGQDPYKEYGYWIDEIRVDGLFTDFTGSFHQYQEWTSAESDPSRKNHHHH